MALFVEFSKTKERDANVRNSLDVFQEIITKRWEAFTQHVQNEQKAAPSKKKPIDPIKNLGKAMNKVVERIDEIQDQGNQELLKEYTEKVQNAIPEQMKPLLMQILNK